jgi:hypothetical protein
MLDGMLVNPYDIDELTDAIMRACTCQNRNGASK